MCTAFVQLSNIRLTASGCWDSSMGRALGSGSKDPAPVLVVVMLNALALPPIITSSYNRTSLKHRILKTALKPDHLQNRTKYK